MLQSLCSTAREARVPQLETSPLLLQPEKSPCNSKDSAQSKININYFLKYIDLKSKKKKKKKPKHLFIPKKWCTALSSETERNCLEAKLDFFPLLPGEILVKFGFCYLGSEVSCTEIVFKRVDFRQDYCFLFRPLTHCLKLSLLLLLLVDTGTRCRRHFPPRGPSL